MNEIALGMSNEQPNAISRIFLNTYDIPQRQKSDSADYFGQ
jgi:hypothetical protein